MMKKMNPYPLGARREAGGICFSFVSVTADCGIVLYDALTGEERQRIPFAEEDRLGEIYCKLVENIRPEQVVYQFYQADRLVPDEHGRVFPGRLSYGKERSGEGLRAGFLTENYDWENDKCPALPYDRTVMYCMHVRGFTRHASSKVMNRGTFAGICEKLSYLKEIGITTLELQPAYEFLELEKMEAPPQGAPCIQPENRVNYWGYKRGFYYAPKQAYAASEDAATEFRDLVKELHRNGMELVMQFYFPEQVARNDISDILRFWALEYHVDGFHLLGTDLPIELLASDPLLADKKFMYYGINADVVYGRDRMPQYPHLAEYNDSFLYDMRRFLKGDENMMNSVLKDMRYIPTKAGVVHYLTNYYGFTLADLVSYDRKHNESNGEENRDGNDYNCSWNCGEEGTAKSRKVRQLRIRQMKNAICLLMLSQGTPLIFMGDEFGNSQKGNNNPWCQDNVVGWLDWGKQEKNRELLEFWKQLAAFRRAHPILHPARELRLMDYLSCDYPDLSYHGESAWRPQTEHHSRSIGMMLCGKYARNDEGQEDAFLYIAINMHWERHSLALPRLPKNMHWELVLTTAEDNSLLPQEESEESGNSCQVAPRSIALYISVAEPERAGKRKDRKVRRQEPKQETEGKDKAAEGNGKGLESF